MEVSYRPSPDAPLIAESVTAVVLTPHALGVALQTALGRVQGRTGALLPPCGSRQALAVLGLALEGRSAALPLGHGWHVHVGRPASAPHPAPRALEIL